MRRRALHILTLSAFAIAQPLYDLIGRHAEFLVAHRAGPLTVAALVAVLSFAVPLLLVALVELVGLIGPRVTAAVHAIAAGVLAILIAGMLLRRLPSSAAVPLAITAGAAFAIAYRRVRFLQRLLTVASPAVLIFPLIFVTLTPAARLVWPHRMEQNGAAVSRKPPIVYVILDELSTFTLLDARGEIDAQRFPGFAALARTGTWFPNALAAFPMTERALPALLTGTHADGADTLLPIAADHPQNLFTWLGPSYDMHVAEPVTSLCPPELCQAVRPSLEAAATDMAADVAVLYLHLVLPHDIAEKRLPAITNAWKGFAVTGAQTTANAPRQPFDVVAAFERSAQPGRDQLVRQFISEIRNDGQPTLHFLHVLLPHDPYVYLPSGRRYSVGGLTGGLRPDGVWTTEQPLVDTGRVRHIAQAQFADKLLGEMLARLEAEGLMDEALVIVTSDHGAAFKPGDSHRWLSAGNYPEIITTPMFVKLPHQKRPAVSDRAVSGLDVLPTIAWALGTEMTWRADGGSMFAGTYPERPTIQYAGFSVPPMATFDVRAEARKATYGPASMQSRAPSPELIGYAAAAESLPAAQGLRVFSDNFDLFRLVRDSAPLPALVQGRVECTACPPHLTVAIAVNGRVEAVTQTVVWADFPRYFAALVPERSLHQGENQLEVFAVTGTGPGPRLATLSSEFSRALTLAVTNGHELITSSQGRQIILAPHVVGAIDRASDDPDALRLWGWAADRASSRPLRAIVAFAGSAAVAFAEPEAERPDVTAALGLKGGRKVSYLLRIDREDLRRGPLRVFGISEDDRAGELPRGSTVDPIVDAARARAANASLHD